MNRIFSVTRETENVAADYTELGVLLLTVVAVGLAAPLLSVLLIQQTPFRSLD